MVVTLWTLCDIGYINYGIININSGIIYINSMLYNYICMWYSTMYASVCVWLDVLRGFKVFQFYPEDFFRKVKPVPKFHPWEIRPLLLSQEMGETQPQIYFFKNSFILFQTFFQPK